MFKVRCENNEYRVGNIYCIGRNYLDHVHELGNERPEKPLVFLKSTSSLRLLNESGRLAFADEVFDYECEIVCLIGQNLKLNSTLSSCDVLAGITVGLDLTRRQEQVKLKNKGLPWTTAKSFVGSAVIADFVPIHNVPDLNNISFFLEVNKQIKQQGHSGHMIFPIRDLIQYLLSFNDLNAGDLIFTGTPQGVGALKQGDQIAMGFQAPIATRWHTDHF